MIKTRLLIDSGVFFVRKEQVLVFGTESWILRTLFNLCSSLSVYDFAICWDSKKSHRKTLYPQYKANRKDADGFTEAEWKEYNEKRDLTRTTILPEIGCFNNFISDGFEADDMIALATDNNYSNIIVSNDHDLYQLLSPSVSIYQPLKKRFYTKTNFKDEFNIQPSEWPRVKALMGDSSDNIPGLPKVGIKTALRMVQRGEFDTAYAAYEEVQRNYSLVSLPYKSATWNPYENHWHSPTPNQQYFEEMVDKYNLEWFYSPMGMGCARKFFNGYREVHVKQSIKIGRRHGSQRT